MLSNFESWTSCSHNRSFSIREAVSELPRWTERLDGVLFASWSSLGFVVDPPQHCLPGFEAPFIGTAIRCIAAPITTCEWHWGDHMCWRWLKVWRFWRTYQTRFPLWDHGTFWLTNISWGIVWNVLCPSSWKIEALWCRCRCLYKRKLLLLIDWKLCAKETTKKNREGTTQCDDFHLVWLCGRTKKKGNKQQMRVSVGRRTVSTASRSEQLHVWPHSCAAMHNIFTYLFFALQRKTLKGSKHNEQQESQKNMHWADSSMFAGRKRSRTSYNGCASHGVMSLYVQSSKEEKPEQWVE